MGWRRTRTALLNGNYAGSLDILLRIGPEMRALLNRPTPFLFQADGELRDCGADGEAGLEQDGGGQLGRRRQHRRVPAGGQDRRVQVSQRNTPGAHLRRRFSRNLLYHP